MEIPRSASSENWWEGEGTPRLAKEVASQVREVERLRFEEVDGVGQISKENGYQGECTETFGEVMKK